MKEIQEDIVWFDLSEYGSFMPAPYTQKTITTVYKQATEMMLDPGVTDTDQYLHQWRAVLTGHKDMNTIEWRLWYCYTLQFVVLKVSVLLLF